MTVLANDVGATLLKKGAPFADSTGRFSATTHNGDNWGGLRNSQKAAKRFDGGFGNRLSCYVAGRQVVLGNFVWEKGTPQPAIRSSALSLERRTVYPVGAGEGWADQTQNRTFIHERNDHARNGRLRILRQSFQGLSW
jgi:hypothetical protein